MTAIERTSLETSYPITNHFMLMVPIIYNNLIEIYNLFQCFVDLFTV